jgi:hypothetical protein
VLSGSAMVEGALLDAGDAAARSDAGTVEIAARTDVELLLFDLN